MKKKLYIKTALLSLASMAMLSSCLKDNAHYVDFAGSKPLVELPAATGVGPAGGVFQAAAFSIVSTPSPLTVAVNLAAPKPLSSALTVKLGVDAAALAAYNTANKTSFVLLPAADYSSTFSVTIPAGQNLVNLVININTSLIDPSQSYVLPVSIIDGGGQQISNYKTVLLNVQVKNKYDGVYTVTGTMVDVTNANLTGSYPTTVSLITEGANTVAYGTGTGAGVAFNHAILSSGSPSSYGTFAPLFTFDPATNKVVSVANFYVNPANGRGARLDVSGVNAVIGTPGAAGSVIKIKYVLTQGGDRTFFDETFTYTGPR